jgi:hypothetical protein
MKVTFKEEGHIYESFPDVSWTSVTKVVEKFIPEFNVDKQAVMSSQSINSKWYGIPPKEIVRLWNAERDRSTEAGSWFHQKMELKAIKIGKKMHRGKALKVFETPFINGIKTARDQVLTNGVYPEHLIFHERIGVCGQSDLVFVCDEIVDISDYKTNKDMKIRGFGHQYGTPKMMLGPCSKLEDCELFHYALQLSIYMKLILMKNPNLKPGILKLIHINFEVDHYDKYGFPVLKKVKGEYVVKEIKDYIVPFLEKEAVAVLKIMMKKQKGM